MRVLFTILFLLSAWNVHGSDGTGMIFGTIRDANTGKPIAGATVKLMIVNQYCPEKELLTNETGEFFFFHLPIGHYQVHATKDGYIRSIYGEDLDHPLGQELLITETASQQELHFAFEQSAAISGHVYDADGNPASQSPVILEAITTENRIYRTFADALGYFYVADLPPDLYKIAARSYDAVKKVEGREKWYYPGTLDPNTIEAIPLQAGKTTIVDIRFGNTPESAWIGKVIGTDGVGVADVDLGFLLTQNSRWIPVAACRTTETGTCSVQTLSPDEYQVYVQQVPAPYAIWMDGNPVEEELGKFVKALKIEPGKQATTEFQLKTGIPVAAKIYLGNGAPAAVETGIAVTLTHHWKIAGLSLPLHAASSRVSTDKMEFYLKPGLPYELRVDPPEPNRNYSVIGIHWNRNPLRNPIQIQETSPAELEIWVDSGASISGRAPNAKIVFAEKLADESAAIEYYSPLFFSTIVQQGNFLLRILPPGTYRIRQNKRTAPFVEVTVKPGESKTVVLE